MFSTNTIILVADDMSTMRKKLMKTLRESGFTEFVEAENGRVAWQKIESASPPIGLVLSDWNMPEATGLDLLKRVRADGRFKTLPFVLITAESDNAQVVEAIQAGVTNYIVKPFTNETLMQKLEATYKKVTNS